MKFISYGNSSNKTLLFIHGLASTYDLCFGDLIPYFQDYQIIFCVLDGHYFDDYKDMISLKDNIDRIENYIIEELGAKVYCICGFSMGATIAVELVGRGNIEVNKLYLDAAIILNIGWLAPILTRAFSLGTGLVKNNISYSKYFVNMFMGKDNNSVIEMMYPKITKKTIKNACKYLYHYKIPQNLKYYSKPVLFCRGSQEPIPRISAKKLEEYFPQMEVQVFEGMGHGQFLHEYPQEYAENLRIFLNEE